MPKYRYIAIHSDGSEARGEIEAAEANAAFRKLRDIGLSPVRLSRQVDLDFLSGFKNIRKQDLALFIRQLAVLLSSGVSLSESISSVANSTSHPKISQAIQGIQTGLRSGDRLHECLRRHLPMLPSYVFQFAELGEHTGQLGKTLSQAAEQYDYDQQVDSEVRQALAYPIFLLMAGTTIIFGMFLFVVPRFAEMLSGPDRSIPALSRLVVGASLWLTGNIWLFLSIVITLVLTLVVLARRKWLDFAVLSRRLPLFGSLMRASDFSRWSRSLAGALENGAELLPALELSERGVRDPHLQRQLARARQMVRSGSTIGDALEKNVRKASPFLIDMVKTGQQTGKLDHMLSVVSDLHRREVRERTAQITALIEPLAIVSISLIVGVIVISIVLAMTSIYEISP